jgi:hypothetical protein
MVVSSGLNGRGVVAFWAYDVSARSAMVHDAAGNVPFGLA